MKYVREITVFLCWVLVGCSQFENSISDPDLFTRPNESTHEFTAPLKEKLTETISASLAIDGSIGGQITIEQDVIDSSGRIIGIYADLIVPAGAYSGIKTISMEVDWKTASVDFNPSMQFVNSLTFHFLLENLPLARMGFNKRDSIQFAYIDPYGNTFPVISKELVMNYNRGRLKVNNAKISHFSRYGFIRKSDNPIQHQQNLISQ